MPAPAPFPPAYAVSAEERAAIERAIDRDELVRRVLELCNIPSPMRGERAAGDYVHAWMQAEGFVPRRVGLVAERFNVVGRYGGHGDGPKLLFTSHLDTESPFYSAVDRHTFRPGGAERREWLEAWLEGDRFHGYAVANDRGPMVCFLLAAIALKRAGIELDGTLYLTACPGEIGPEPEPTEGNEGVAHVGRELGAAYLLAHGGVAPDFAIAAEGTDFGLNWAACGYCYYRISLYGEAIFTPILDHARTPHDNPIVRMGRVVEAITAWAQRYEREHRYQSPGGGTVVPKVQIGAIRGGNPQAIGASSEVCSLYLEVITGPRQSIGQVDRELRQVLRAAGIGDCEVEPYAVRTGFEADPEAVQPLRQAIDLAHRQVRGGPVEVGQPVFSSMWRDHNVFNMNRIPAVTLGPVRWLPSVEDMLQCTLLYALTALALCGRHAR
ncbi:MAG: hypothetical protein QM601_10900 [Pseudoxanthomonas sp.]